MRRKWQPTPGLLPGKSHGQMSLVCYSPLGHRESDMPELTFMHPPALGLQVAVNGRHWLCFHLGWNGLQRPPPQ